jgi:hypothetical protein
LQQPISKPDNRIKLGSHTANADGDLTSLIERVVWDINDRQARLNRPEITTGACSGLDGRDQSGTAGKCWLFSQSGQVQLISSN